MIAPDFDYEITNAARAIFQIKTYCFAAKIRSDRLELQRRAIHSIAQTRGFRAVGKDMAEMAAAVSAMHLGAGGDGQLRSKVFNATVAGVAARRLLSKRTGSDTSLK
jgi:hypothetical protein